MNTVIITANRVKTLTNSVTDYVTADGETLIQDSPTPSVLVRSESDLAGLPAYPPGSVAYTAGWNKMWQKSAEGQWVSAD